MTEQEIKDRIENNLCLECGKPITDDSKLFCQDCYEKSMKYVNENGLSNEWTIHSVILLLGIFGWNGKEVSMEKLKEIFSKKDDKNDGN
jgi:hypothetical protein